MHVKQYGIEKLGQIIPVDKETCEQMIEYALTLPTDHEIQQHFLNLLGESDDALEFVGDFIRLKNVAVVENNINESNRSVGDSSISSHHKKIPIQKEPAPRRSQPPPEKKTAWGIQESDRKQSSPSPSRVTSSKPRLANTAGSATTSQLLNLKPSQQPTKPQVKRSKRKHVDNLKDIEAALNELEVNARDSSSEINRVCNCMGLRHPLFEFAPNCLNCGKIICSKEGLQPCSNCGKELISYRERAEIANILREEKLDIENKKISTRGTSSSASSSRVGSPAPTPGGGSPRPGSPANVEKLKKPQKIIISMGAGNKNLFQQQDLALKKIEAQRAKEHKKQQDIEEERKELEEQQKELEFYSKKKDVNPDLENAQERLETLLNFQATGAQRTRIIDQASDFELPNISGTNLWTSPMERALQLKRQQKHMRKQDEVVKARSGRGKVVMDMTIRDGKVILREKLIPESDLGEESDENEEIKQLESEINGVKLREEDLKTKNIWDPEKDKEKWERPIYIKAETDRSGTPSSLNGDEANENIHDILGKWARVQVAQSEDSEALLVDLPTS